MVDSVGDDIGFVYSEGVAIAYNARSGVGRRGKIQTLALPVDIAACNDSRAAKSGLPGFLSERRGQKSRLLILKSIIFFVELIEVISQLDIFLKPNFRLNDTCLDISGFNPSLQLSDFCRPLGLFFSEYF